MISRLLLFFTVSSASVFGQNQWVAYNDCKDTDPDNRLPNITTYGWGRNYAGDGNSGELVDSATGEPVGVTVTFFEQTSTGETINSAGDAAEFDPESDAAALFGGWVNPSGNMSYNDGPGWYLDATFTGLDPEKYYTFAGTANRNGGAAYRERVTNWSILDAEESRYASSEAAFKISEESVEFSTGDNYEGLVAQWTDIRPGEDGTIVIRTTHGIGEENGGFPGAHGSRGYGGGMFLLAEQDGPTGGGDEDPVEVFRLTPLDGTTQAHPNTPIQVLLRHRTAGVDAETIVLTVNDEPVTVSVTGNDEETQVTYASTGLLAAGSTHTATLSFQDDSGGDTVYSETWSFTVEDYGNAANYPVIPVAFAEGLGSLPNRVRGFGVRIAAVAADGPSLISIDDAEAIWELGFENLADLADFNADGYYLERDTLNYQTDGNPRGVKAGEQRFPGIESETVPGTAFAFEARAMIWLRPGFYAFNTTVDTEFELYLGPGEGAVKREDAPWVSNFIIEQEGLYPLRIVYYNEGASGSLELLEIAPSGARHLVNSGHPDGIAAYIPADLQTAPLRVVSTEWSETEVQIDFETPEPNGTHGLFRSTDLAVGSWEAVSGATFATLAEGQVSVNFQRESGNEAYYRVELLPPPPVFLDDFESGAEGWVAGLIEGAAPSGTSWELGTPSVGPAAAFSGENAWGTGLEANYTNGTLISLKSPVIDLAGVTRPRLKFQYYIDTNESEGGRINFLNADGSLLSQPDDLIFLGSSDAWQFFDRQIPVDAWDKEIIVEFQFLSDNFEPNGTGWFIDDVMVER